MIANEYGRIQPAPDVDYHDLSVATADAFTWADGIQQTGEHGLFGVEFTSAQNLALKAAAPDMFTVLQVLDTAARVDAEAQPGFDWYFADEVSPDGRARSFCLWDSQAYARDASERVPHRAAVGYAMAESTREVYDHYGIHKFRLERRQENGLIVVTSMARMAVARGVIVEHQLFSQNEPGTP